MSTSIFEDFCGGYEFWNESRVLQDVPEISPCFTDTVLVWVPYGYLWLAFPPFAVFMSRQGREPALPWSCLQLLKTVASFLLFCLAALELFFTTYDGYLCQPDTPTPTSVYVACSVKAATYLLILLVQHLMRRYGVKTSGIPYLFWLVTAVSSLVPLYSLITSETWCSITTVICMEVALLWSQLVLNSFADEYHSSGYEVLDQETCPEENASILSRLFYHWITSLVVDAYKKNITSRDLWQQNKHLRSSLVVPKFFRQWRQSVAAWKRESLETSYNAYERYRSREGSKSSSNIDANETTPLLDNGVTNGTLMTSSTTQPLSDTREDGASLFRVVFSQYGWEWMVGCFYKLLSDSGSLVQPLILRRIIALVEARNTDPDSPSPTWLGVFYTFLLFATSLVRSMYMHRALYHMVRLGLKVKTALVGTIYRKSLTMSNAARKTATVGEIVNLMSVDCQRIQDCFTNLHFIASLPFCTIVVMVQIYLLMGNTMWAGLGVVCVCTCCTALIGKIQQRLQKEILHYKGQRIKLLNEMISGIKVLKMYTWEKPFKERMLAIRNEELKRLWTNAITNAFAIMFAVDSPFLINYFLLLVYTLSSNIPYLDAETTFVVLSLVNIMRGPIVNSPFLIRGLIHGYVSTKRIQTFLWHDDVNEDNVKLTSSGDSSIKIQDGTFTWNRQVPRPTLNRINLEVKEGQLYAVVGQVGHGKSSLISAILGEMEKLGGDVRLKGSVAYVPQEAWIQNLTVRDNILFGKEMDENRYATVLSGCALLPDLEVLSGGDMTEIGEKGINISGGQKQRVSLARAVYSDADIYLMDDPLSAVDSHVGKHLFRNVIGSDGLLKTKTRLLVTHGIHWLPMMDKIIVLTDGHISEMGTYAELVSRDGAFAQFLKSYTNDEDDSEDESDDEELHQAREMIKHDLEVLSSDDNDLPRKRKGGRIRQITDEKAFGMSFSKEVIKQDINKEIQTGGRLVKEEESQKGVVGIGVFITYGRAMGLIALLIAELFMVAFQGLDIYSNIWLTYWTEDPLLKNTSLGHTDEYEDKYAYYLGIYSAIGFIQSLTVLAFGIIAMVRMVHAGGVLHERMLTSVLRSPMSYFNTTPVGRIMNRFASDVDIMDDRMPMTFRMWNIQVFMTISTVVVVSITTPMFMIAIVPVAIIYFLLLKFFLPTARQVKRIESVLKSPVYNHFSETLTGVSVIRAYRCQDRFITESEKRVDNNVKFFYAALTGSRWIGIRLEVLGNMLIFAASMFALFTTGLNGATVGLSITYALKITNSLNAVVQAVSQMEMNIVSIERVKEYTELKSEAPWVLESNRPYITWPEKGNVDFKSYTTRYRPGLDLVLRGISCHIESGEKVGIVGRTGAGKSSLTLSLFRLLESAGGDIVIDGVTVADIGLHDLRSKITILPQDPVLFSGSLRMNLDPFGRFSEDDLWRSLESAHLKEAVRLMPGELEYECGEGGSNLSMGQRQLVCLARTLLHKTKILILDEATAAVDLETDDLIQATIRQQFEDCTVITIAHRLNTILDYDRVMVMDQGLIKEFDSPTKLLQNRDSVFYGMARSAGLVS